MAAAELERRDARSPVKAASCLVIFLCIPEGAVVLGIESHAAVITPPVKARLLHSSSSHCSGGTFHRPGRIGWDAPHQFNARIQIHAGGAETECDVSGLVHRDAAHPEVDVGIDDCALLKDEG
jgi:hypothetical protein